LAGCSDLSSSKLAKARRELREAGSREEEGKK